MLASIEGSSGAGEKVALIALALITAAAVISLPTRASARVKVALLLSSAIFTPILLAIDVWNSSQVSRFTHHHLLLAAAVIATILVIGALSELFRRSAWAFPLAAVFTLPFRVPISSGGSTANLLVPLYAVIAAGVLAHCVTLLSAQPRPSQSAAAVPARVPRGLAVIASPRTLRRLIAVSLVLYAIQATYSEDFSKALQNVTFFYVPFALMLCLLAEVDWTRALLARCLRISVALAALFVAIGFLEYARKSLLLNASLVSSNVYGNYFRVNSVFYDPNIYGRYLALVMLLLASVTLWGSQRREVLICAAALAWLWAGLLTSISQTSMVALLVGLAVLAGWRFGARKAAYTAAGLLVLGAIVLFAAPSSLHFGLKGKGGSVNNATSGRASLIQGGLRLFADRPLAGFGSGSFSTEYRAHQAASVASSTSASHTIPITVAAEQGILGLVVYLALLVCCFGVLFSWVGRSPPGGALREAQRRLASPAGPAICACFTALLVHTMAYADFLEDPITWALLGIGIALAGAHRRVEAQDGQAVAVLSIA
jgi:O-antigen ligase